MWMVQTSLADMVLFAQTGTLFDWELCLPTGALVAFVALGIWAIVKVKRWHDEAEEIRREEQITQYEKLAEDGLLDPEELARIKARLEARFDPTAPNTDGTSPLPTQPPDSSIQEK
jgi:hypothetical protein